MMKIVLVTGGARAGKSRWAEDEAGRIAGDEVVYVATAERGDEEMTARIAAHRASRPPGWITVEAPLAVPEAVGAAEASVVLIDCVTVWVSNLMHALSAPELDTEPVTDPRTPGDGVVSDHVEELLRTARAREGTLLVVTNEVGLGVVPDNALARRYRDMLGWVNARIAREAHRVLFLVAGLPMDVR
ncbi:MAG: bifunctional adenosylcobinamide kinase/adenosylcobinamide-phosphate guanylyltransferase [Gemmatimonadota bacterium]|nr:bifunctional adenosylcobinamide kinase/adenosylcobinamide-phosphate guanylyltransferase [Gemmatimonadota bacterium]